MGGGFSLLTICILNGKILVNLSGAYICINYLQWRWTFVIIYNDDEHSLLFTVKMNIRYYLQRWWTFVVIYRDDEHSLLFTVKMNIRDYLVLMNIRYNSVVITGCVENELYLVKWTFKSYHEHYFYLTLMYIIIAFICLYCVNALVSHSSTFLLKINHVWGQTFS